MDILQNGDQEKRILKDHLNNLHPNLTWTVECGREGGYLDLWLMLENGKIEWKNYIKDVESIIDRIMYTALNGTIPTMINVYAKPANHNIEEK